VITVGGQSKVVYDFDGANHFLKYGDLENGWLNMSKLRVEKWGFNTVGCTVNPKVWSVCNKPFTVELWTDSLAKKFAVKNSSQWMVDVFDANFPAWTDASIKSKVQRYGLAQNSNLIGYTTDNELPFCTRTSDIDLPVSVLGHDSTNVATKAALVNGLVVKYSSIASLNQAWGTSFGSWDDVNRPISVTVQTDLFKADMRDFVKKFVNRYCSVWKASIRKYDVNHMYLGAKLGTLSKDVVDGMIPYVDAISFHRYDRSLAQDFAILDNYDFPVYLSEFGTSTATGNNFAIGNTDEVLETQDDRAGFAEDVFRQALANKNVVGAHFYKLYDDPVTGNSWTGENCNWGLCDVTDTPYNPMISMFRRVNADIYKR
jgi:agarase